MEEKCTECVSNCSLAITAQGITFKWIFTMLMLSSGTSELICMSLSLSVKCCGIPGRHAFKAMILLLHTS